MRRLLALFALSACQPADPVANEPGPSGCTLIGCTHAVLLSLGPLLDDDAASLPLSLEGSVGSASFTATVDLGVPGPACLTSAEGTGCCPVIADDPGLMCSAAPGAPVHLTRALSSGAYEGAVVPYAVTVLGADGAALHAWEGSVVLSTHQPNGPACEPTCYQGGASLE